MARLLTREERLKLPATQTYKFWPMFKGSVSVRIIAALALALCVLLPTMVKAQTNLDPGLSRRSIPAPGFRVPDLGDIAIWRSDMLKARTAYRNGNYIKARVHLEKALKNKNFVAAWYLGHIYRLGLDVPRNSGRAFYYYRVVALQFDDGAPNSRVFQITLDSLVRVADGYRTGIKSGGVKKDLARAMRLYMKASRRGHPAAQFKLARLYMYGQGTRKDTNTGLRWLFLSAKKNYPPALALLGDSYWKGKILKKSKRIGTMLYIVATRTTVENLNPQIFATLEKMETKISAAQYHSAEKLADEWLRRYPPKIKSLDQLLRRLRDQVGRTLLRPAVR